MSSLLLVLHFCFSYFSSLCSVCMAPLFLFCLCSCMERDGKNWNHRAVTQVGSSLIRIWQWAVSVFYFTCRHTCTPDNTWHKLPIRLHISCDKYSCTYISAVALDESTTAEATMPKVNVIGGKLRFVWQRMFCFLLIKNQTASLKLHESCFSPHITVKCHWAKWLQQLHKVNISDLKWLLKL